jgi:hypothetical protein
MNEKIKQLVLESGEYASKIEPTDYIAQQLIHWDKFAELIVKECLDIALEVRGEPAIDTHYVIGYDRACVKMIDGIKEHFGVER